MYNYKIKTRFVSRDAEGTATKTGFNLMIVHVYIYLYKTGYNTIMLDIIFKYGWEPVLIGFEAIRQNIFKIPRDTIEILISTNIFYG